MDKNKLIQKILVAYEKTTYDTNPPSIKEFEKALNFKSSLETIIQEDQKYDEIGYVILNIRNAFLFETFNTSKDRCISEWLRKNHPTSRWEKALKEGYKVKKIKVLLED